MAKKSYLPVGDQDRRAWLTNLIAKLEPIAPTLSVSPEEMLKLKSDGDLFAYSVDAKLKFRTKAQEWTEHTALAASGTGPNQIPSQLVLGAAPAAVDAGIFPRVIHLIHRIKHHPNYTTALGRDLGIIGPETTFDTGFLKPVLDIEIDNGRPVLSWAKKNAESLEILADRGTGSFVPVTICTTTKYVDNAPLPTAGTGVIWKYKAIYRRKDSAVGQWSDDVSVGVFG